MKVYKVYIGFLFGEGLVSFVLWIYVLGNMYLYLCILELYCVYMFFFFYCKWYYMVLGLNWIVILLDRLIIFCICEVLCVEKFFICISFILFVVYYFVF